MTTPELEELFQRIGQSIADVIPEPWDLARVIVDVEPGVLTEQSTYIPAGGGSPVDLDLDLDTIEAFDQLHQHMADMPTANWTTVTFELTPDGMFQTHFGYGDVDGPPLDPAPGAA